MFHGLPLSRKLWSTGLPAKRILPVCADSEVGVRALRDAGLRHVPRNAYVYVLLDNTVAHPGLWRIARTLSHRDRVVTFDECNSGRRERTTCTSDLLGGVLVHTSVLSVPSAPTVAFTASTTQDTTNSTLSNTTIRCGLHRARHVHRIGSYHARLTQPWSTCSAHDSFALAHGHHGLHGPAHDAISIIGMMGIGITTAPLVILLVLLYHRTLSRAIWCRDR